MQIKPAGWRSYNRETINFMKTVYYEIKIKQVIGVNIEAFRMTVEGGRGSFRDLYYGYNVVDTLGDGG